MTFLFLFFFFWGVQSEIINHTNIVTKTCHNMESVCYQSATGWGQVNMQSVFGNTSINCDKSLKITQQSSVYKEIRVKLLFKSKPSTISLSDCS